MMGYKEIRIVLTSGYVFSSANVYYQRLVYISTSELTTEPFSRVFEV